MKFEKMMASAVGATAMIVIAAAPAALAKGKPPPPPPNQYSVACNDGTVLVSPEVLWPPNHKLATITITYVETTSDADSIGLTINSITDDQISEDPGTVGAHDGCGPAKADWVFSSTPVTNTDPNAAATTVQVSAERCANLGDRRYDINLTCASAEGSSQTIDVPVVVPHNKPKKAH